MKRTSFAAMDCPVAAALEAVGEWWSLLVVRNAFRGPLRFDELQAQLGIARNILTRRLRALVDHGVLERRRYQAHPPRFEYTLTPKGRALFPVIVSLASWGMRWSGGDRGVAVVDLAGRSLDPVLVDRETGAPLGPETARMVRLAPPPTRDAAPPRGSRAPPRAPSPARVPGPTRRSPPSSRSGGTGPGGA